MQLSILPTALCIFLTFKFAAIQFGNALSFSAFQKTSRRETNLLSKHLYFQSSIDYIEMRVAISSSCFFCRNIIFRIPNCMEQLLLSNIYFLVTNTLSKHVYFFQAGASSESYFFIRGIFSGEKFLEKSQFFCNSFCVTNLIAFILKKTFH